MLQQILAVFANPGGCQIQVVKLSSVSFGDCNTFYGAVADHLQVKTPEMRYLSADGCEWPEFPHTASVQ